MKAHLFHTLLRAGLVGFTFCAAQATHGETLAQPTRSAVERAWIDPSIRPQDDLYRAANGKRSDRNDHAPGSPDSYARMHLILKGASASQAPAGTPLQRLGDLYASLTDEARIAALGTSPLKPVLARIDAMRTPKDVATMFGYMNSVGVTMPVELVAAYEISEGDHLRNVRLVRSKSRSEYEFAPDFNDDADSTEAHEFHTRHVLQVASNGLSEHDYEIYFDDDAESVKVRQDLTKYMVRILELSGDTQANPHASRLVEFMRALARIHVDTEDDTPGKHQIGAIEKMAPHFDWNAFFEAAGATKRLTNTQVIPETTLRQLDTLLRTTPLETMQLYLRYQYVNARARYLPQPFFEAYRDHFEAFRTDGTVPRDTFATEFVGELLPDDMLHVYVDRYQTPARKARLQSMVDNIKRAFERQIGASSWMAAQSRANALNTIRTMDVIIGAPDTRPDYSRLQIDRDSLFANVERAARYQHNLMLKKVDSPFDQKDIQIKPLDSAFYNSVHNVMFLPTDQTEGFDPQADDATAYAGVGVTIGHEIAHAFSGVRFPGVRGWTPADLHRYSNWTQTLVDQYSAHTPLPGHPIDGQRTLIENIADNLGLEATYDAYVNLRDIQVPDPADGLTRSQRFFFCYAQGQYRSQTDEELAYAIKYDPHTPGVVANNATVRNLPGFYQAFDVKHTDAMFLPPGRRARLW